MSEPIRNLEAREGFRSVSRELPYAGFIHLASGSKTVAHSRSCAGTPETSATPSYR